MANAKGITIELGFDDKSKLKLRAIAKHVGALADELDRIDNLWQCECGAINYEEYHAEQKAYRRECKSCGESYLIPNDELPTRLEGSE